MPLKMKVKGARRLPVYELSPRDMAFLLLSSRAIFLAGIVFWSPLSRFSEEQKAVSLNSLPRSL